MGWWDWLFGRRHSGAPRSSNGASSFHLNWALPGSFSEVSAVLTVVEPPSVDRLYFWALQVSFGSTGAGAHVGLQWAAPAARRAANWGGYGHDGRELDGSPGGSTQPFEWSPGVPYTLRVRKVDGGWEGSVMPASDGAGGSWTRTLFAPGDTLTSPVVWSEVFAWCDDPSVRVRWSGLSAVTETGEVVRPSAVGVSYQSVADGGCSNTDVVVDGDGFVQTTSVPRVTPVGSWLQVQP
ncbi:MAG TPA: hypothetical protein VFA94_05625 [Acidimicrobiales bacterium]|nr:hypothetical protein [Acidimicrobiales bacterium]